MRLENVWNEPRSTKRRCFSPRSVEEATWPGPTGDLERRAVDARLPSGDDLPQQRLALARQFNALDELREIARDADQHAFDEHHRERRPPGPHLQRKAPSPLA